MGGPRLNSFDPLRQKKHYIITSFQRIELSNLWFIRDKKDKKMACSAIYFLDNKGKVLISRNYRGDIENSVIDKFIGDTIFILREFKA